MPESSEITSAPQSGAKPLMAPLMERFAVPALWLLAGYALGRLTAPKRKAQE